MYGEYIEIKLDQNNPVKVFVLCTPNTSEKEKKKKALIELKNMINRQLSEMKYVNFDSIQEEALLDINHSKT